MRFNRRRPDSARCRLGSSLEVLEVRVVLSTNYNPHATIKYLDQNFNSFHITPALIAGASRDPSNIFSVYRPSDLTVTNPITGAAVNYSINHQLSANPSSSNPLFSNEGKIVSGKDRAGDEWTITVHGPGYAIVNDTTPNDGVLDDNIASIQLVGTSLNSTYVTGNVVASVRTLTPSTIPFGELIAQTGVKSIVLNGFNLQQTVPPPAGTANNTNTGIQLYGGVQYLQFNNIVAPFDTATTSLPITVQIGDPTTPLPSRIRPTIVLNNVQNTVFSSTASTPPPLVPQTTPSVNFVINGQLQTLSMTSAGGAIGSVLVNEGADPNAVAAQAYLYPAVATAGRTSVQALGATNLYVYGGATNLTASRAAQPFQNGFSGLNHLNNATFNGPTDGVGIDVNGPVGTVDFNKGAGNATNVYTGTTASGAQVSTIGYGTPADQSGYANAGYVAAQVTSTSLRKVIIRPSTYNTSQRPVNPDFIQVNGIGTIYGVPKPGVAAANTNITSQTNIGRVNVTGDLVNSEIKSGFSYQSYAAGLEGTRAPSTIAPVSVKGNLINSVVSATVRPVNHVYSTASVFGPGKIAGNVTGTAQNLNGTTALGNTGAGVYARTKVGKLPQR